MLDIHFDSFPTLETERLILRRVTVHDAETLFALRTNPDVLRYLGRDKDKDVAAVLNLIEFMDNAFAKGDGINWGIARRGAGKLIGVVCFWRIDKDNHRAEVGYMLHPDEWGQGIMSEAFQAALDFGFSVMKIHSIEAGTTVDNVASQAMLLRCGFVKEAHLRERWHYNGKYSDSLIFCKLAGESS